VFYISDYSDFFNLVEKFNKEENRAFFYDIAIKMVNEVKKERGDKWLLDGRTISAIMLIEYTWNFASPITKKLTHGKVKNLLMKNYNDLLELQNSSLTKITSLDNNIIVAIFEDFKEIFGQTGASKALAIINPNLFVMWDTEIRKKLKIKYKIDIGNGQSGKHYLNFLRFIKSEIDKLVKFYGNEDFVISRCEWKIRKEMQKFGIEPEKRTLAKLMDEYFYAKYII